MDKRYFKVFLSNGESLRRSPIVNRAILEQNDMDRVQIFKQFVLYAISKQNRNNIL